MKIDREQRRLNLFRKYSTNLELWRPEFKGQYACPLCLAPGFDEDSIRGPNPKLTDEHGIQKGLGQSFHVLTCASCNHTAGHRIDNHLHKRLEFEGFWRGQHQKPLNVRMNVGADNVGIDVVRIGGDNPRININVIEKQSCDESITRVQEALRKGPPPVNLKFDGRTVPVRSKSKIAILKAAYLLAFRYFGYGYLLSHVMDPIRQTILDPDNPKVPLDDIILDAPIDGLPHCMAAVTSPEELESLLAPIPVLKYRVGYLVALPNGEKTYERWANWRKDQGDPQSIKLRWRVFPDDDSYLTEHFMGFGPPQGLHPE